MNRGVSPRAPRPSQSASARFVPAQTASRLLWTSRRRYAKRSFRRRRLVHWSRDGRARRIARRLDPPAGRRSRARPAVRADRAPRLAVWQPGPGHGARGERRRRRGSRRRRLRRRIGGAQGLLLPAHSVADRGRPQRSDRSRDPQPRAPAAATPGHPGRCAPVRSHRRGARTLRAPHAQGVSGLRTPAARADPPARTPDERGTASS